jgi:hypothetical protein
MSQTAVPCSVIDECWGISHDTGVSVGYVLALNTILPGNDVSSDFALEILGMLSSNPAAAAIRNITALESGSIDTATPNLAHAVHGLARPPRSSLPTFNWPDSFSTIPVLSAADDTKPPSTHRYLADGKWYLKTRAEVAALTGDYITCMGALFGLKIAPGLLNGVLRDSRFHIRDLLTREPGLLDAPELGRQIDPLGLGRRSLPRSLGLDLRENIRGCIIVAALADQPIILVALAALLNAHVLADLIVTSHTVLNNTDGIDENARVWSPSSIYEARYAVRSAELTWTPAHFIAARASESFSVEVFALLSAVDMVEPHSPSIENRSGDDIPPSALVEFNSTNGQGRWLTSAVAAAAGNVPVLSHVLAASQVLCSRGDISEDDRESWYTSLKAVIFSHACKHGLVPIIGQLIGSMEPWVIGEACATAIHHDKRDSYPLFVAWKAKPPGRRLDAVPAVRLRAAMDAGILLPAGHVRLAMAIQVETAWH